MRSKSRGVWGVFACNEPGLRYGWPAAVTGKCKHLVPSDTISDSNDFTEATPIFQPLWFPFYTLILLHLTFFPNEAHNMSTIHIESDLVQFQKGRMVSVKVLVLITFLRSIICNSTTNKTVKNSDHKITTHSNNSHSLSPTTQTT